MFKDQVSIVLSGEAGQGLDTIAGLMMQIFSRCGFNAFTAKEFMSRIRGGNNTIEIRISSKPVAAFSDKIDILVALSEDGVSRLEDRLDENTVILGGNVEIPEKYNSEVEKLINLDFKNDLKELGNAIYSNIIVAGLIAGLFDCNKQNGQKILEDEFESKGEEVVSKNLKAFEIGLNRSKELNISVSVETDEKVKNKLVLKGSQAVGAGALIGGCDFMASYPMSPSTGVLVYLAGKSKDFGVVVEQAEDEIAAINMMLGAWYAGARAMVTTSGGGFALMNEGLSLAGIIESPAVIHLAQRPGPATGLPTRTEQGDLNFAIYGGHGEFPRIVYAPGNLQDAIKLTAKAFNIADQFQVPVIILTDQYLLDSSAMIDKIDLESLMNKRHIVETEEDYQRYAYTESGLSPRGIPGYGKGMVCLDSDEHDQDGRITEDFTTRVKMVDKRAKKMSEYNDLEPEIIGSKNYKKLIVGWGSTREAICKAMERLDQKDLAFAYFKQVFPIPEGSTEILNQADEIYVVENNSTGQFAQLLQLKTGKKIDRTILKYNGMPFAVEELVEKIKGGAS